MKNIILTIAFLLAVFAASAQTEITKGLRIVKLNSDVTNNNATPNTMADVTGLSASVTSGVTYYFKFTIYYTAAAGSTGSRWSINGPSATLIHYTTKWPTSNTGLTENYGCNAYDLPAVANASTPAQSNSGTAIIEGFITPSADGTLIARFASEIASSAIVAKANTSHLLIIPIN